MGREGSKSKHLIPIDAARLGDLENRGFGKTTKTKHNGKKTNVSVWGLALGSCSLRNDFCTPGYPGTPLASPGDPRWVTKKPGNGQTTEQEE